VISERRRLAFAAFRLRPLDAFDRVVGDDVLLAAIFVQRCEPVPDRCRRLRRASSSRPAVMWGTGQDAEFRRPDDAGEADEVTDRGLLGATCARVAEVGEPLELERHVRQPVERGGGEQPTKRYFPSRMDRVLMNVEVQAWQTKVEEWRQLAKVLVIEDDDGTAEEIMTALCDRGYVLDRAADGTDGLERARAGAWDVLVVDRMLPGLDGLSVIETLRQEGIKTPVLVLSALNAVNDRVRGLRAGGDDYLAKPFALAELAARLEALLRRPADPRETLLRVGPLELDLIARAARRGQRELELLPREFQLLEYMMRREGQVLTRAMLLENVWNYRFVPQTNLVDVHIGRLRRKVDAAGEPPMILSIRGAGFQLRAPA
jgi:two-component system, OmpR family, response regulator